MRTMPALFLAASLPLAAACDEREEPADTSFEEQLPAPVPVDDGPGVPDNEIGTPTDDVEVDYDDGATDAEGPTEVEDHGG